MNRQLEELRALVQEGVDDVDRGDVMARRPRGRR